MAPEDGGLLGNLPRSRPGTRSAKRDSPPPRKTQGAPRKGPAAKKARAAPPKPPPAPAADERQDRGGADPVGDALRTAARAGQAGARVASELTREVLRRLPRL